MGFPSNSVTTTKYSHKSIWRILRWPTALAGLVLIVVGQVQLASQTLPAGNPISLGKWLNDNWHLAIPSIDNVLRGAPLMLAGILLLAIAMRGLRLLPPDECPLDIRPFAIRLIRSAWPWVLVASVLFIILIVQLYQMSTQALLPMLWVATLAIFTAVIVAWDRRRQVSAAPRLSRQDLLWLIGLLLVGLLIATYRLQGWPDQLMGDEGNFWTIARDMARGLLKPSPFGVGVYSFPIFSSFLQAWGMNLFGIDVWGWRFGSVLAGVATVIPLYLLAREAFDRKVAIVASIVLITSPYFLDFSRLGYNNIQALFITVLALYWLYTGLQRSSNLLVFLAGIACGLGFYTFFSARGTVVVALAFVVLMWWTRKFHFKQAAHAVLLIGLGVLLVATPYFVYGYRQDPLGMGFKTFESVFFNTFNGEQFYTDAQLFKYAPAFTLGGNQLFFNPQIYGVLLMRGLIRTLLIFQKPWLISEHYIAFPLTGSVGSIFYVIGFFLVLKAVKQPRSQLILLWFLMEVLGFSTLNTVPPRYTHMVAIIPALALLTALGILGLVRAAAAIYTRVSRASNLILAVLLGAVAIGGLVDYFVTSPAQYPPQPDQIMSWAALESHGEQFIYVYTDPSQAGFRPYIVSEFRQDISFTSIPFDQFTQTSLSPESPNGTVVFYPPQISSQISPILYAQWGKTLIQRHFFAADDTPVLTASMNVPFVFERDHPLPDTFLDSLRRPAFLVLLALLVLALVTVAFFPTAWFPRFPTWLRPLADWFNRPETAEELFVREQEFEPLEIEAAPAGQAPTPAEPPEWAEVLPDAAPSGKSGRLAGVFRAVPTDSGRDIYLRIHIPRIRLPSSLGKKDLDISLPPVVIPGSLLLLAAVVLAAAAQVAIFIQHALIGGALYLACVAFLFVWAWKNPRWKGFFANQLRLSPLVEGLLLAGIVVAAAILRFHDLAYRVYGLEGDETKWTIQSWYSAILRVNLGDFATLHYQFLPVDFWVRSLFLRLFGLNFISGRIEAATLGLISVVLLFFLVRRLTLSRPLALLSALLYAFAFVALNASHQALPETSVEVWVMGSLTFTVFALMEQKWWQFQLAGVLIALGMLTYETFFPTVAIAALYTFGYALYRVFWKKEQAKRWITNLLLMGWPILIVYLLSTRAYVASRSVYDFGWVLKFSNSGKDLLGFLGFLGRNIGDLLATNFSHIVWTDSLLNWTGPYINPLLLPFVVIGLVNNLWNLRRPLYSFLPIWYLIDIAIAPLFLGSVWPRVLFPGLAPLLIWGAMGLWTLLGVLRSWLDSLKVKLAAPLFVLFLAAILANDILIFTHSLLDPLDRQKRRELSDLTAESAGHVPMILFPFESNQDDPLDLEKPVILFSVAGTRHDGLDASKDFVQLDFSQLLPTLWQDRTLAGLDMFFDKTATTLLDQRAQALALVLKCYPDATRTVSGQFFDVYHFDAAVLSAPDCFEALLPKTVSPENKAVLPATSRLTLTWDNQGTPATSYQLTVDQKVPGTSLIEAEEAFQGSGWSASSDYVIGFSGTGFLLDDWHAGVASYNFLVSQPDQYRVWVRFYKRRDNDQHNFISLDGKTFEFAKSGDPLNEWVWADLGTFDLPQGSLPITLSRTYDTDEQYSVFIDSVLITQDLTHPADQVKIWQPLLDTGEIASTTTAYTIDQSLPANDYRWRVRIFDGDTLVDSAGARGEQSADSTFSIQPK